MSLLRRFARALVSSKKAVAATATAVFAATAPTLRKLGIDIGPEQVEQVIVVAATYIGAQGLADFGKGKVQAERAP